METLEVVGGVRDTNVAEPFFLDKDNATNYREAQTFVQCLENVGKKTYPANPCTCLSSAEETFIFIIDIHIAREVDFGSDLILTETCHFLGVRPLLTEQT